MENNNKNLWIASAIVLIVVAGLVIFLMINSKNMVAPTLGSGETPETAVSPTDTTQGSGSGNKTVSISYAKALVKYKDARIQLDKTCQATPANVTFKNGAELMIDNRSPQVRTVKVGSVFSIKAYGFKIVKLSSATLPMTWYVDCDKSQNVATVFIQK